MKEKKKLIIGLIISLLLIVIAIFLVLFMSKNKKIIITFDSDGGVEVEKLKIKKGSSITLPETEKEGFIFIGWYNEEDKVSSSTKYYVDTKLVANWLPEDAKTYKITFDSDGGTKVDDLIIECDTELKLPENPTKNGYIFVSWVDQNERAILDGALLACEDITLKANWKQEEAKSSSKQIKYTCPSGYTLDGTKCVTEGTAHEKCGERGYDYNGKCVTITYNARKDTNNTCGKTTVHTGGGHTEEVEGELFKMGTNYCFFKEVTDSYESNQSNCTSRGHYWNSINSKCYYYRGGANEFVTSTCDHLTGYAYIVNPNDYEGVNGLNGGCYPLSDKIKYCDDGYTLTNGKCIKTIEATIE